MQFFQGKKILAGISGGIAAYKTCDIVRGLKKQGAACRVVMTEAAQKFISPLTFWTLTEEPVLCDNFSSANESPISHIEAARWADIIVLCPATANLIGKVANGIGDNLLSTIILATTSPVVFCPAMNTQMYLKPVVQENIRKLSNLNYQFVQPATGKMACNEEGIGKLADKQTIFDTLRKILFSTKELAGRKVLITAGRTEESIDPVRFLTNHSSGKMGYALAEIAAIKGAEVTLISGPSQVTPFPGVRVISVQTAKEMASAVFDIWQEYDIIISAAAVADFRPREIQSHKIKKSDAGYHLKLEKTTDILGTIGTEKENRIMVGFAVETQNTIENARNKLIGKNLDLIVLNNPLIPGSAFKTDTNQVSIIDQSGKCEELETMPKWQVAEKIFDRIILMQK